MAFVTCSGALSLYGFLPYIMFQLDMHISVYTFIYVYTLATYLRWYREDLLKSSQFACDAIIFGLVLGVLSQVLLLIITPSTITGGGLLNTARCVPSLAISLGLILLAVNRKSVHSRFINALASSTLSVYLLLCSAIGSIYLAHYVSGAFWGGMYGAKLLLLDFILLIIAFIAFLLFDFIRQIIFKVTVSKFEKSSFEYAYARLKKFVVLILSRVNRQYSTNG